MGLFNCSRSIRKQAFDLPIHDGPTQLHQLTDGKDREKDSEHVSFADPLRFDRIGQTIDAFAYETLTQGSTGEAFAGLFTVRATLREGSTGGPPGFAMEQFVAAGELQFVRKILPPQTPAGVRGIVPGQVIVRMIPEGQASGVDDRYWIELPAKRTIHLWMKPFRDDHEFGVTLVKDKAQMASQESPSHYIFDTSDEGVYELRIVGKAAPKEPDRYSFYVSWGRATFSGELAAREIAWRGSAAQKGK